jgi:site-specific DNA-methyltransferase (adenine-specific)
MLEMNQLYLMDCMVGMAQMPDKYFELAIVDPPYGIGIDGQKEHINKNPKYSRKHHEKKNWDLSIPNAEYFRELERVSANQIVWGGNYFVEHLHKGTKGWIVWDKGQHGLTMSDCELAYSSFGCPTRVVVINRVELLKDGTIHPTQKPVALYKWLLTNYAKPGDKILDTHVGSASSLIACHDMGFDYMGFEIDKDYWQAATRRLEQHKAQVRLDIPVSKVEQGRMV